MGYYENNKIRQKSTTFLYRAYNVYIDIKHKNLTIEFLSYECEKTLKSRRLQGDYSE